MTLLSICLTVCPNITVKLFISMSCNNTNPLKQEPVEHIYTQRGPQEVCNEFILSHDMKKCKNLSGYSLELSKGICLQLSGSPGQGQ